MLSFPNIKEDKLTSTKKIYEKLPLMRSKQTNFQRMVEPPPASNVSMKAKYLSKMPLYSSYSMFSNESNESLNVTEDKTADTTLASPAMESPSSVKLNFRYGIYFFFAKLVYKIFKICTWNFNYNVKICFQYVTLSIFYQFSV